MAKKLGIQTKGTGRAALQGGGIPPIAGAGGMAPVGGAARRDMRSGYYPSDMGMRGGAMYNKGGRVGLRDRAFAEGGKVKKGSVHQEGRRDIKSGDASEAEKIAAKNRREAKKKRDKSQAQHVTPGGRLASRPGPHKRSVNRRDLKPLIEWLPEKTQEKIIKFADKFDEKQHQKGEKKRTKKKFTERAKKLTAYEGTT